MIKSVWGKLFSKKYIKVFTDNWKCVSYVSKDNIQWIIYSNSLKHWDTFLNKVKTCKILMSGQNICSC